MRTKQDSFIANLSMELKPQRFWSPAVRASFWSIMALVFNIFALLTYQSFRPGFGQQLLEHPRFLSELVFATLLTSVLIHFVFVSLIPGYKLSRALQAISLLSFVGLAATLSLSFNQHAPKASPVGARAFCVEEVALYGLIGMVFFYYFIRKSDYPTTRMAYFVTGVAAGLVPGTLMQLSCMYAPMHGLLLHYGPSLILGGLGALILPLFKKVRP